MKKYTYFLDGYIRCGEMPLFLIFYRTKRGIPSHCVMLCTFKKLRELLRKRRGFKDPAQYGRVLYSSHGNTPSDMLKYMLKARYDFDLENYPTSDAYGF